jgi:transposase InsO family protein
MTGEVIRASRSTALRYERARPGELVHIDVKKLGRIPLGGGWRLKGETAANHRALHSKVGYDYVHSIVDDHSRFAYSEILDDETGVSCAGFLRRAGEAFRAAGIWPIKEVMTDNAKAYTRSLAFQGALREIEATHLRIKPHCPWQNGKVERLNRTLLIEWAYRRPYTSNAQRTRALATWLRRYNRERPHSAIGGQPPISRLSTT